MVLNQKFALLARVVSVYTTVFTHTRRVIFTKCKSESAKFWPGLAELWRTDTDKIMKVVYTTSKALLKHQRSTQSINRPQNISK